MAKSVVARIPPVRITPRGERMLSEGWPWVYAGEILDDPAVPAGVVGILSRSGKWLGQGFFNPKSVLRLRKIAATTRPLDDEWIKRQLTAAVSFRQRLFGSEEISCRLVHGEMDHLPGVVMDRIGKAFVMSTLCAGADTWIDRIAHLVQELFSPDLFVLKNTSRSRQTEGLPLETRILSGSAAPVSYYEGDRIFVTDLLEDQKTGAFLDQRDNHELMRKLGNGAALDLFCYHGGFALAMAKNGAAVTALDASAAAVERLTSNAENNGVPVRAFRQDVFDFLQKDTERWDTIVCDPPALCPTAGDRRNALGAYRQLAAGCLSRLKGGGMLLFCSCSAHVSPNDLLGALNGGAAEAGRPFGVLKLVQAGPDHPSHPRIPESAYLKGFLVRAN